MGNSGQATEYTLQQINAGIGIASSVGEGRKVVASAGTAEALAASTAVAGVLVTAETNNTGMIAVGGSGVIAAEATREGTPLFPGDSVSIDVDNLAAVYVDSTVNGDGVTYIYKV